MRKFKLYLDTSVISHLFAEDTPDRMEDTNRLWQCFCGGEYDLFISPVVVSELEACAEPKRGWMLDKLRQIKFEVLPETDEVTELAKDYIKGGVLKEKSIDDCYHIAYAVVNRCDAIVSWNFKHLVNYKTIDKVRIVNAMNRYQGIGIITPTMLLEEVDE